MLLLQLLRQVHWKEKLENIWRLKTTEWRTLSFCGQIFARFLANKVKKEKTVNRDVRNCNFERPEKFFIAEDSNNGQSTLLVCFLRSLSFLSFSFSLSFAFLYLSKDEWVSVHLWPIGLFDVRSVGGSGQLIPWDLLACNLYLLFFLSCLSGTMFFGNWQKNCK